MVIWIIQKHSLIIKILWPLILTECGPVGGLISHYDFSLPSLGVGCLALELHLPQGGAVAVLAQVGTHPVVAVLRLPRAAAARAPDTVHSLTLLVTRGSAGAARKQCEVSVRLGQFYQNGPSWTTVRWIVDQYKSDQNWPILRCFYEAVPEVTDKISLKRILCRR